MLVLEQLEERLPLLVEPVSRTLVSFQTCLHAIFIYACHREELKNLYHELSYMRMESYEQIRWQNILRAPDPQLGAPPGFLRPTRPRSTGGAWSTLNWQIKRRQR